MKILKGKGGGVLVFGGGGGFFFVCLVLWFWGGGVGGLGGCLGRREKRKGKVRRGNADRGGTSEQKKVLRERDLSTNKRGDRKEDKKKKRPPRFCRNKMDRKGLEAFSKLRVP